MAVEKITQRAVDLSALPSTDTNAANISQFGNLFGNTTLTQGNPYQTRYSGGTKNPLFGNKIVKDEEGGLEEKSELPKSSNEGLDKLSKFFHHQKSQFKNLLNNIGSNVNEYDAAVNNALKYLPGKGDLDAIVDSNKRIHAILAEAGQPVKMNYENLKTIKHSHIATTVEFSRAIGKELGMGESELQTMEVGAALHDIGKTLIPSEILNKEGKLTTEEREVVNRHSVLGYEILKSAGFGTNVAEIARDHHNPNSKNKMAQIVRAADVYSAMTEKRSYKEAKSHEEAMGVLNNMGIDKNVLAALDNKYGKKEVQQITLQGQTLAEAV